MAIELIVLGAAAGGGLPQWNCTAGNSGAFWLKEATIAAATQSSVAVGRDNRWTLLNASPDIRHQIINQPRLWPTAAAGTCLRRTPIKNVLITDGDIDHVAGLLTLRERMPFRLLATDATLSVLMSNPIFSVLADGIVVRSAIAFDTPVDLNEGLSARIFPVPGKVPLYLERPGNVPITDEETDDTVGVELTDGERRCLYIPSCARLTDKLAERLDGADLVLFDGTVFDDDELLRSGVGQKTGRRMGHLPMAGADGSLAAFTDLRIGRKILHPYQ